MHRRDSMSKPVAFLGMLLLVGTAFGCSDSTVPAHELDAFVDVGGHRSHAVLSFPDHDGEEHYREGDSSCKFFSGNCGSYTPTYAKITGDAPIQSASLTTDTEGRSVRYHIVLKTPSYDGPPRPTDCFIYIYDLGTARPCGDGEVTLLSR